MKRLILEEKSLRHNLDIVKEKAGSCRIWADLSGDADGVGVVAMARFLRAQGIGHFAVSEVGEAQALRKAGFVDEDILMLRSIAQRETLDALLDLNVICTIGSLDAGLALNTAAEARSTVAEAQVQVDAGLGFGGFLAGEPEKLVSVYRNLPCVALSGLYTQVNGARPDGRDAAGQLEAFRQMVAAVGQAGFEPGEVYVGGSFALLHCPLDGMDAVRAGSVLLGRCRRVRGDGLIRVGYGEAPIQEIRWFPKGRTVGYETLVTLRRNTRVAVLPVGYQNGLGISRSRDPGLWAALRRWWRGRHITVRIGEQKARIIGRIGAAETLVDVTDLKCAPGDPVRFDIDPMFARDFSITFS